MIKMLILDNIEYTRPEILKEGKTNKYFISFAKEMQ